MLKWLWRFLLDTKDEGDPEEKKRKEKKALGPNCGHSRPFNPWSCTNCGIRFCHRCLVENKEFNELVGALYAQAMIDPTLDKKFTAGLLLPHKTHTWCPKCIRSVRDMKKLGRTIRVK